MTTRHFQGCRIHFLDHYSHFAELRDYSTQMIRAAVFDFELTISDCGGNDKGSGFDSIGNDRVFSAAKCGHAFDLDRVCSSTVHTRAHLVEQLGEVDDLRFESTVAQCCRAARECRGHHQVFRACDGDFVELNICCTQAAVAWSTRDDVSGFESNLGAKFFESR